MVLVIRQQHVNGGRQGISGYCQDSERSGCGDENGGTENWAKCLQILPAQSSEANTGDRDVILIALQPNQPRE
jgi:hypothetical protein